VWGGTRTGLALLDYLNAQGWLVGSHILSLGAGLGAFEMVAAAMGGHVVATDLGSVIPLLEETIKANKALLPGSSSGSITPCVLDWGEPALPELVASTPFDFICASDCVHFEEWRGPLLDTLASLSTPASPPTVFLFIEARSPNELVFLDALEEKGFVYGLLDESHSPALSPTTNGASALVWARRRTPTLGGCHQ
jgi:hypothetical protein